MTARARRAVLAILVGLTAGALLVAAGNKQTETQPAAADLPIATVPSATSEVTPTTTRPATTTSTTTSTTLVPGQVGVFTTAPGQGPVVGTGSLVTYTVEVEDAVGVAADEFASLVDATLADPHSWIADGSVSFQRVAGGGQVRVVLATPTTVDQLCLPLDTAGLYSCFQGGVVALNSERWLHGTETWPGPLDQFHAYAVNHEMGHAIGHGHVYCPATGQLAPVMMQQSKGLEGCLPNGWPHP